MSSTEQLTLIRKAEIAGEILKVLDTFSDEHKLEILLWVSAAIRPTSVPSGIGSNASNQPQIYTEYTNEDVMPNETIQNFLKRKDPTNTYQRLACLGFYLEDRNGKNLQSYSNADLVEANDDAKQIRMSNASAFINDSMQKYKFFTKSGNGKHLTTRGQDFVRALPHQDRAKLLLAKHVRKSSRK